MFLNLKTHYSLEAFSKPDQLVKKAKQMGHSFAGIADHSLSGVVKFVKACKENEIKPILGYTREEIFIAKNRADWEELLSAYSDERLPNKVIYLIGSPFCGLANKLIKSYYPFDIVDGAYDIALDYVNNFGNPSHVGLCVTPYDIDYCHAMNDLMRDIAEKTKLPIIEVADVYYPSQEDAKDHRIQVCHRAKKLMSQKHEMSDSHRRFFEHDWYSLNHKFSGEGVNKINSLVEEYEILSSVSLPHFSGNPDEELRNLCRKGWLEKIAPLKLSEEQQKVYVDRVKHELEIIRLSGYPSYFLIAADIVRWCNNQGWMTGPGRGSAGGCLVSYLSGITRIDPVKYELLFERFYDKSRAEAKQVADIDVDFPASKREYVIDYIKEKYGHECVAQMVTFSELQGRSALKAVLRYNGSCSNDEINIITSLFPELGKHTDIMEVVGEHSFITYCLEYLPELFQEYARIVDGEIVGDYAEQFKQAIRLEGTIIDTGKHACAVIISDSPLQKRCPIMKDKHGASMVGFEGEDTESVGLLKLDVLGLSCLDKLMIVNDLIKERTWRERL